MLLLVMPVSDAVCALLVFAQRNNNLFLEGYSPFHVLLFIFHVLPFPIHFPLTFSSLRAVPLNPAVDLGERCKQAEFEAELVYFSSIVAAKLMLFCFCCFI